MGKMPERIRTIDCPLSKKRVFRGARFECSRASARGCGAYAQRIFLATRAVNEKASGTMSCRAHCFASIATAIIQAIVAHVYLAWIHPFGDGNGRTARLVELFLLLRAGVPVPAAHLLSNFYNSTRSRYYTELSELSRPKQGRYPLDGFLSYAVEGLVDGLENQLSLVASFHLRVIWENHVYSQFRKKKGEHHKRLRDLLLSQRIGEIHRISSMSDLLPDLYHEHYRNKTLRTLQRDLRTLVSEGYLESTPSGYQPKTEILQSMLPKRAQTDL